MSIAPCAPATPIKGVVVFEPGVFIAKYPMFSTVDYSILQNNFTLATLQLNNSCGSRVCDAATREILLDLLTAHITALLNGVNGLPPSGIVGRVSGAQQGSVSVESEMGVLAYGQAYYMQTQWGAIYWQSTARWRQAVYIPGRQPCYGGPSIYSGGPTGTGNCGYNGGSA